MKVIVSDYDLTLVKDRAISEENKRAICKLKEDNAIFVIATGRNKKSLISSVNSLDIYFDYVIASNGAVIFDNKINTLFEETLSLNDVKLYMSVLLEARKSYSFETFITSRDLITQLTTEDDIDNWLNGEQNNNIINIALVCTNKCHLTAKKIRDFINERVKKDVAVCNNHYIDFIGNYSKATSIEILLKKLELSHNDLFVIGDSDNDISMFDITENSYALSFSEENVKKKANNIVTNFYEFVNEIL